MTTIRDKTLVAWVYLDNTTQRGGSTLTIDDQASHFDGIVFGERAPGKWMAGSDMFRRSTVDQSAWPAETAGPDTLVQMAIVYRGNEIAIYRNGQEYARYSIENPREFGPRSAIVIGLRHIEAGDRACFAGRIEEARVYDVALTREQIAALEVGDRLKPVLREPIGWWTFEDGTARDLMGRFPVGRLMGNARIADGKLILDGKGSYMIAATPEGQPDRESPIHFRPAFGRLADTIPFYWNGEYHVFYLLGNVGPCTWEHIVSTDLVHWKELPTALKPDPNDPEGPDGGHMFTGSVVREVDARATGEGPFHIFYTGHNPRNPQGMELVMHATSPDLVTWMKHPEDKIAPDGVHYANAQNSDFRDPYVFFNEEEKQYWMVVFARDAKTDHEVQGLLKSPDLKHWEQAEPLEGAPGQECPDLFSIGGLHYLIGGAFYTWSEHDHGPYHKPPVSGDLDRPNIYAAKRMFDGKRHIWVGWIWDIPSGHDGGEMAWGGTMSLPREVYAGPGGQLYSKPAEEVVAVFEHTVLSLRDKPRFTQSQAQWSYDGQGLHAQPGDLASQVAFGVPDNYLLDCRCRLDPRSKLTVTLREQAEGGYRLTLDPARGVVSLSGSGFSYERACPIDTATPVKIQAFVQGTIIECFINDQYAQTCRAYDHRSGKLGLSISGGPVTLADLSVRTPAPTR